jgi:hypothetical protein
MIEIINLRMVRKRTAREKAARNAAESRVAHGAPKAKRVRAQVDRERNRQMLDQHRIETGDRR